MNILRSGNFFFRQLRSAAIVHCGFATKQGRTTTATTFKEKQASKFSNNANTLNASSQVKIDRQNKPNALEDGENHHHHYSHAPKRQGQKNKQGDKAKGTRTRSQQQYQNNQISQLSEQYNSAQIEQLERFEACSEHLHDKKYEAAAYDIREMLDFMEENKAGSDSLQLMELQNSLFIYSRKYLEAYLVQSNIQRYMQTVPAAYKQAEIHAQPLKLFYQLIFTNILQAEQDLDLFYKNAYKQFTPQQKAQLDLAAAAGHFISPDKEAAEKGVSYTLNCLKDHSDRFITSAALTNLAIYQHSIMADTKHFMQELLSHEKVVETTAKKVDTIINKIEKNEKISAADLSSPIANILAAVSLNESEVIFHSLQELVDHQATLLDARMFSNKALLFVARNYNQFNISTQKSLRTKLTHLAYSVAQRRKQHKAQANFLYASLFADLHKTEEAKKLLSVILEDTSNPMDDPVRYESYHLMSILDFQNKYALKKQAQQVIIKDSLSYYAVQLDQYELPHLHMLPQDELCLETEEEVAQYSEIIKGQKNGNQDISETEEDSGEEEEDAIASQGHDESTDEDETDLANLEKQLKNFEKQLEALQGNSRFGNYKK